MPNWVNTYVTVFGDEETIAVFFKKHFDKNGCIDFDTIIPQPKTKEECPDYAFVSCDSHIELDEEKPWFDWYEWNYRNWGTKWNACDGRNEEGFSFSFYTAWVFPKPIFNVLRRMYPTMSFLCLAYDECGDTDTFVYGQEALEDAMERFHIED